MWSITGDLGLKLVGNRLQLKRNRIIWAEGSLPAKDKLNSTVGITDFSMGSEPDCWPFSAVLSQICSDLFSVKLSISCSSEPNKRLENSCHDREVIY